MRKKAKREYEKKLLKRFKDKPKLFYSYVRNKQKVQPEIPQLNTGDGIMTSSDEEIAHEFGEKKLDRFSQGKLIMRIIIQISKVECMVWYGMVFIHSTSAYIVHSTDNT